ncbi:SRPBCC family protein [Amycolatopsis echigonensis]|uniref:SRPBCC family protein n=1 Tax=Amycolatopsis echigonensis TaxID=2576905 RepID=A0A8E1W0P1_9PSEU|nr:SRPBCC family protein [Amycolatopsis echigonensis]
MHERVTDEPSRIVRASREIEAPAERIFELIADPAQQPSWDGNDNLAEAEPGQRVHAVGDVFTMTLTYSGVRRNRIVEFEEGRRVAWRPSEPGREEPGHLWRWELKPLSATRTEVTHTYDWSDLDPDDTGRNSRARSTTVEMLESSLENLAKAAERPQS